MSERLDVYIENMEKDQFKAFKRLIGLASDADLSRLLTNIVSTLQILTFECLQTRCTRIYIVAYRSRLWRSTSKNYDCLFCFVEKINKTTIQFALLLLEQKGVNVNIANQVFF